MRYLTALLLLLVACVSPGDGGSNAVQPADGVRPDGSLAADPHDALAPVLLWPVAVPSGALPVAPVPSHLAGVYPIPPIQPIIPEPVAPVRVVVRDQRPVVASLRGVASYYCNADPSRGRVSRCSRGHPDGRGDQLYAAIRRDLLSRLRGRRVTVTASNGRRVVVTVIDCNCGPNANLIDLYGDALAKLVPLTRGTVDVEVRW